MRVYRSTHQDPAWNLAAEEILFHSGQDALFLYVNEASVILGCNQAVKREVDFEYCAENQIKLCRRMSGGGAVYHDAGNLNFCFLGRREASSLGKDFLQPIVSVLRTFGLETSIGGRKDLWIGNRKISGTASHFAQERSLQHGTLLFDSDLIHLHGALGLRIQADGSVTLSAKKQEMSLRGVRSQPSPVANVRAFLEEDIVPKAFFDTFAARSCEYFQCGICSFSSQEEVEISALAARKYRRDEWIYKR